MKIILGSGSESKLNILHEFFPKAEIVSLSVNSDVTEQPLDRTTTIKGSINRAKNAITSYKKEFDYAVGMEAGLEIKKDIYNLVCVISFIDKNGNIKTTTSELIPLPKEVSDAVSNGEEFGVVIREYQKKDDSELVRELISRHDSFL